MAKVNPSTSPSNPSPWGKRDTCPVKSFMDVMDEEYAKQLEEEDIKSKEDEDVQQFATEDEEINSIVKMTEDVKIQEDSTGDLTTTDNDLMLAKLLQLEYDHENDEYVRSMEKTYNGGNKVSMSFKNYFSQHPYDLETWDGVESDDESDDDEEDELDERKPTGKVKHGGEIITKHDSLITERRNVKNIEQFPSSFQVGDIRSDDIRLPDHVYNKLKLHSMKEEKGEMRIHEKQEHSTHEKALDENTRLILYKMVNNGTLDSLSGVIATGKEAVIIYAKGGLTEATGPLPAECAIKIFKTTLNEFKTREKYIKEDYRFRDRFTKVNSRKVIRLWAEKEFRNLKRMEEAGINCPKAVLLRKHVLIMSFVGIDRVPACKLKDAQLNKNRSTQAYLECIQALKILYERCNLVHADFSEYNVLWHDSKCVFIDVSQSIEPEHPQAFHFLLRDCRNVVRFFTKSGVNDVMKEEELFEYVCGKPLENTNLDEIENECKETFESDKDMLACGIDSKTFEFDYHFKQAELSRTKATASSNNESRDDQSDTGIENEETSETD